MTQAREMVERLGQLETLLGEEMTQHPIGAGSGQGIPSEYRGMAKVVRIKDDEAKKWWGIDMPLYIDTMKGETNLLTPGGQMASIADVNRWFDLEVMDPHP